MKTLRSSEQTETNGGGKMPRRNSAGRTASKLGASRNGRIIKAAKMSEEGIIRRIEKRIPRLAETAMKKAYHRALASGSTVLIAEDGQLKEVYPDGTKRVIKKIEPSIKIQKGLIIKIK